MNILIISPLFPPEPAIAGIECDQLATALTVRGHSVSVVTSFPSRPGGSFYPGYRLAWRRDEFTRSGYRLIRTLSIPSGRHSLLRIAEYASFGVTSFLNALSIKADVIYSVSWPILGTGMSVLLSKVRRLPVVVCIQDIHPEAALAAGHLASMNPLLGLLKALDGAIVRRADAVHVISENFKRFYRSSRSIPEGKLHVIPNWMDEEVVTPGERNGEFRRQLEIRDDAFVAMYAGNIGAMTSVKTIIHAANLLRDEQSIVFVMAGDGSQLPECRALAESYRLTNVRFFSPWKDEPVSFVHGTADLLVLPMRKSGSMTSVPSKLIAYMLSGRPILAAVDGLSDTAMVLAESGAGRSIPPEDHEAMATAVRSLQRSAEQLSVMGEKARQYALRNFSRTACVSRLVALIESIADTSRPKQDAVAV